MVLLNEQNIKSTFHQVYNSIQRRNEYYSLGQKQVTVEYPVYFFDSEI